MPDPRKKKQPAKSGKKQPSRAPATHKTASDENFSIGLIGFVILFMVLSSLLFLLDIFGVDAPLIDGYANLMKGFFGAGYFLLPFVFLIVVGMALFTPDTKRRPSQFTAMLLLPFLIGAWGHLFTADRIYLKGEKYIASIYTDGKALHSGGLISGTVADFLSFLISPYGAGVLLFVFTAILAVWLCRFSLSEVLATALSEFRRIGEDSDRAMDEKKEEYRKLREEKRVRREEQKRLEAEERAQFEKEERARLEKEER